MHGTISPTNLSYVDLKKEIERVLPIKDRIDEARELSKRYRHFPEIVVQPPDSEMTTTSSMPNIHYFFKKESPKKTLFENTSETNSSCPDLRDETFYSRHNQFDTDSFASMEIEDDDFFENVSVCSEGYHHDSEPDCHRGNESRYFGEFNTTRRKVPSKMIRRRRKEEQPTEVLKKNLKVKHSTSLYNLPSRRKPDPEAEPSYDSYYTVHGENNLTHHSPSAYSNYAHFDYPSTHQPKHNLRTNYGSVDRLKSSRHSVLPPFHPEHSFYTRSNSSPHTNPNQSHNIFNTIPETEIIYKCCCGGVNCKKVVPIFDYLETYFGKTVRFF